MSENVTYVIPVIYRGLRTPWLVAVLSVPLVIAAVFGIYTYGYLQCVHTVLCCAGSAVALFTTRLIMRKKLFLVPHYALFYGLVVVSIVPPGIPIAIAPVSIAIATLITHTLPPGRQIRFNAMALTAACIYAVQHIVPFAPGTIPALPETFSGTIESFIRLTAIKPLMGNYPSFSPLILLIAAALFIRTGIIRPGRICTSLVGASVSIFAVRWFGLNVDTVALVAQISPAFVFSVLFVASDMPSSPITRAGKTMNHLLFGMVWPWLYILTESILLPMASVIACNAVTPFIDRLLKSRPHSPMSTS
jgi:hypothetical protein